MAGSSSIAVSAPLLCNVLVHSPITSVGTTAAAAHNNNNAAAGFRQRQRHQPMPMRKNRLSTGPNIGRPGRLYVTKLSPLILNVPKPLLTFVNNGPQSPALAASKGSDNVVERCQASGLKRCGAANTAARASAPANPRPWRRKVWR